MQYQTILISALILISSQIQSQFEAAADYDRYFTMLLHLLWLYIVERWMLAGFGLETLDSGFCCCGS